jgi:hypothetical protein
MDGIPRSVEGEDWMESATWRSRLASMVSSGPRSSDGGGSPSTASTWKVALRMWKVLDEITLTSSRQRQRSLVSRRAPIRRAP